MDDSDDMDVENWRKRISSIDKFSGRWLGGDINREGHQLKIGLKSHSPEVVDGYEVVTMSLPFDFFRSAPQTFKDIYQDSLCGRALLRALVFHLNAFSNLNIGTSFKSGMQTDKFPYTVSGQEGPNNIRVKRKVRIFLEMVASQVYEEGPEATVGTRLQTSKLMGKDNRVGARIFWVFCDPNYQPNYAIDQHIRNSAYVTGREGKTQMHDLSDLTGGELKSKRMENKRRKQRNQEIEKNQRVVEPIKTMNRSDLDIFNRIRYFDCIVQFFRDMNDDNTHIRQDEKDIFDNPDISMNDDSIRNKVGYQAWGTFYQSLELFRDTTACQVQMLHDKYFISTSSEGVSMLKFPVPELVCEIMQGESSFDKLQNMKFFWIISEFDQRMSEILKKARINELETEQLRTDELRKDLCDLKEMHGEKEELYSSWLTDTQKNNDTELHICEKKCSSTNLDRQLDNYNSANDPLSLILSAEEIREEDLSSITMIDDMRKLSNLNKEREDSIRRIANRISEEDEIELRRLLRADAFEMTIGALSIDRELSDALKAIVCELRRTRSKHLYHAWISATPELGLYASYEARELLHLEYFTAMAGNHKLVRTLVTAMHRSMHDPKTDDYYGHSRLKIHVSLTGLAECGKSFLLKMAAKQLVSGTSRNRQTYSLRSQNVPQTQSDISIIHHERNDGIMGKIGGNYSKISPEESSQQTSFKQLLDNFENNYELLTGYDQAAKSAAGVKQRRIVAIKTEASQAHFRAQNRKNFGAEDSFDSRWVDIVISKPEERAGRTPAEMNSRTRTPTDMSNIAYYFSGRHKEHLVHSLTSKFQQTQAMEYTNIETLINLWERVRNNIKECVPSIARCIRKAEFMMSRAKVDTINLAHSILFTSEISPFLKLGCTDGEYVQVHNWRIDHLKMMEPYLFLWEDNAIKLLTEFIPDIMIPGHYHGYCKIIARLLCNYATKLDLDNKKVDTSWAQKVNQHYYKDKENSVMFNYESDYEDQTRLVINGSLRDIAQTLCRDGVNNFDTVYAVLHEMTQFIVRFPVEKFDMKAWNEDMVNRRKEKGSA